MDKLETTNIYSDKCSGLLIPTDLSPEYKELVFHLISKANKLYHLFQYEQAFKLYSEVEAMTDKIGHVCYRLGVMYHDGHYVKQDSAKASEYFSKALELLSLSAEKGEAESLCDLGYMYYCGRGTKIDYEKALNFYQEASNQGHCRATNNLGHMYRDGCGTKTDLSKACDLYKKAGDKGYDRAQSSLAFMYLKGYGVPNNKKEAIFWYQLAAFQRYDRAIHSLKSIFCSLSPQLKTEYKDIAPRYLSEKWPSEIPSILLLPASYSAILEVFLIFRHWNTSFSFPIELVYLWAKYIIRYWTYEYPYL